MVAIYDSTGTGTVCNKVDGYKAAGSDSLVIACCEFGLLYKLSKVTVIIR